MECRVWSERWGQGGWRCEQAGAEVRRVRERGNVTRYARHREMWRRAYGVGRRAWSDRRLRQGAAAQRLTNCSACTSLLPKPMCALNKGSNCLDASVALLVEVISCVRVCVRALSLSAQSQAAVSASCGWHAMLGMSAVQCSAWRMNTSVDGTQSAVW